MFCFFSNQGRFNFILRALLLLLKILLLVVASADLSGVHDDCILVHGLIGVDMLKYMGPIHLICFMN